MAVVSTGILSAAILADQYFASLAGPGGVAAFGYGGKIMSLLIGLGALPLGWQSFHTLLLRFGKAIGSSCGVLWFIGA